MHKHWLWMGRAYRAPEEEGEGGEPHPTPAEINHAGNNRRLARMQEIANTADGRRSSEMSDVEGENPTGRFASGEFDESDEAKERRAEEEDARAQEALDEQAERASADERARELQSEGGEEVTRTNAGEEQAGDEKLVNGVMHYLTVINGRERWMTLAELRDHAKKSGDVDRALQSAQEALQRNTDASLRPNPGDAEQGLDDASLENVILSAVMGDGEAVKTLVSAIKHRQPGSSQAEIHRQVSQQLATQREIDKAEQAQVEITGHKVLGPIFRQRLSAFAREAPDTKIVDAYGKVAASIRTDFGAMLSQKQSSGGRPPVPQGKADRKRTLVTPPNAASRAAPPEDPDREVPVSSTIDEIAKGRGQSRAIRQGRR